jgi:hypothetical protein
MTPGWERLRALGLSDADAGKLADELEPLQRSGASTACGLVVELRRGRIVHVAVAAMRKMLAVVG